LVGEQLLCGNCLLAGLLFGSFAVAGFAHDFAFRNLTLGNKKAPTAADAGGETVRWVRSRSDIIFDMA
jgi:hypothetical protein